MTTQDAMTVARDYHSGWTSKNYDRAIGLLSPQLEVEAPINDYPTRDAFAAAVQGFGELVTDVDLISTMSVGNEAMLLYDMQVEGLGELRVVEHFTIADGKIV